MDKVLEENIAKAKVDGRFIKVTKTQVAKIWIRPEHEEKLRIQKGKQKGAYDERYLDERLLLSTKEVAYFVDEMKEEQK